jgi:Coenzyme PQQ synthesis protein D (PqqD)
VALSLRPGVLLTETEYGMALLDQGSGEYWTLNPTAATVVRELLDGRTTEQAVATLTSRYDVSAEVAGEDVTRIVDELTSAKLLSR